MATLKLKINEHVLEQVLFALSQFSKSDVEIVESEDSFVSQKAELEKDIKRYESGEARVYTVEEADQILERTIREYEA